MRNFLLFFLCCTTSVFLACSAQETTSEVDPAKAIPVAITETTPTTKTPSKPRGNQTFRDPARPTAQIDTIYPFDIELQTIDGDLVNTSELLKSNGKPTVVLFWLTTCYPCRIEMKAIQKEIDQWKAETDFNIIAVSTDFEKNHDRMVKMVKDNNWSFESYWDLNREFRRVLPGKLNGLPQSFIFDKDGKIAYHKRKYYTGDEQKLYAKVKELASK